MLESNYVFLRAAPQVTSIMDYFGPWPIYIAGNSVLTIALCFLAYLPFDRVDLTERRTPAL